MGIPENVVGSSQGFRGLIPGSVKRFCILQSDQAVSGPWDTPIFYSVGARSVSYGDKVVRA